jgi:hypothetical protein
MIEGKENSMALITVTKNEAVRQCAVRIAQGVSFSMLMFLSLAAAAGVIRVTHMSMTAVYACLLIAMLHGCVSSLGVHWSMRVEKLGRAPGVYGSIQEWGANAVWPFLLFGPVALTLIAAKVMAVPFMAGWTMENLCEASSVTWLTTAVLALVHAVVSGNVFCLIAERNLDPLFRSGIWSRT